MRLLIFRFIFTVLFLVAMSLDGICQTSTIEFLILDEKAQPLPFVNVAELGTINGTISDLVGKASMITNGKSGSIQISHVGYRTIVLNIVELNAQEVVRVSMQVDEINLAEIGVIDIGTDPKTFLLDALTLFYRNSRNFKNYPKYRYTEDLVEMVEQKVNTIQLAALIIKSRGKIYRTKGVYSGKQEDSDFLVQTLSKIGTSTFDYRIIPITNSIIKYLNTADDRDLKDDLIFQRFSNSLIYIENRVYDENLLTTLDWRISKLQKTAGETLVIFEHTSEINSFFYDKIAIKIIVGIDTKQIKTISLITDRDITLEPLPRSLPDFKDKGEYEAWDREFAEERAIQHSSLFLGKGQTIINYYYDGDTPILRNVLLNSQMYHHTFEGDYDIRLQSRLDLVEILSNKNTHLNNYIKLNYLGGWPDDQ